ncbi:MAG: hypothetical protein QM817_10250 [Archangium sp.]
MRKEMQLAAILALESHTLLSDDDVRRLAMAFLLESDNNGTLDLTTEKRLELVLARPEWSK